MLSASKSGSASGATGYNLTRSLRFRASASASLSRTNTGTVTNNAVWTWSAWVKIGYWSAGNPAILFGNGVNAGTNECSIKFVNNQLNVINYVGSVVQARKITTAVYRDPSAWYHIVVSSNSSTALNIYVNGVQVTAFDTNVAPNTSAWALNTASTATNIGYLTSAQYFDGEMTEINFIDGQALTPSSFGSTNALTGVWQPAAYTGTYGTNGFYLPFTDNSALTTSSNVGLGKDFSGNGNYWTTNNISITAGATYDSMTDVPTLTSATAANFAVLNPLTTTAGTYSNANLQYYGASAWRRTNSTIAVNSNKWYWEVTLSNAPFTPRGSSTSYNAFGFGLSTVFNSTTPASTVTDAIILGDNAYYKNFSGSWTDSGSTFVSGDVLSVAVDLTANTFTFYRNNSSIATGTIGVTAGTELTPIILSYDNSYGLMNANFGQRPFTYTPPTGYVALNTYNLPTSTIVKGNTVMDATLYTGTGASLSVTNAASFKPDLVWVKSRSAATDNKLTDSVRGVTKGLISNTTGAETTDTNGLTAFNSNGWTLGTDTTYNNSGATYVGWQWQAGQGSTSSNTNGTITSTVSVNASAGFSVVTYTGTGANATVGHGLGVAPSLVICKSRNNTYNWTTYHSAVQSTPASSAQYYLYLNLTDAAAAAAAAWNNTAPTSSVFSVGSSVSTNGSGSTQVAYCWTPIAGYSAFGSYTGNGSTDGPFVYTGFRPKFVMIKRTDSTSDWYIWDTARDTYNVVTNTLLADTSGAETSATSIDDLSNGFKCRSATVVNASGGTYIYVAFAETPFKNSLAR
jgi:hypothetical protein